MSKARPDLGSLVPLALVAKWCGRCSRTLERWRDKGTVLPPGSFVELAGKWYVKRDVALALRDGNDPNDAAARAASLVRAITRAV